MKERQAEVFAIAQIDIFRINLFLSKYLLGSTTHIVGKDEGTTKEKLED